MTVYIRTNLNGSPGYSPSYGRGSGLPGGAGYTAAGTVVYNYALITGGGGGTGAETDDSPTGGAGGRGGVGVDLSAGAMLVNETGHGIKGGGGGSGQGTRGGGVGGAGGAGVDITGATLLNDTGATITGGTGGLGDDGSRAGAGGAGVYLNGGSLTNAGTITGGTGGGHEATKGAMGDAVKFGPTAGKLIVDPGAVFTGQVVAVSTVADTLQLTGTESGGTGITLGTQFTLFQALSFTSSADNWTVDVGAGAATAHTLEVKGFTTGNTIDITNEDPTQTALYFGEPGVDVFKSTDPTFTSTTDGTVTFAGDSNKYFILSSDGDSGTDVRVSDSPCFRRGTHISSEHGEVAIETLKIGDRVATLSGEMRPIRWIGRRSYSGEVATGDSHVLPIRIQAGALGAALPKRDLWVSPEHALYVDGMLIPAAALVNGGAIIQEDVVTELTYIHLEFDGHTVIFAEGAPAESFVDDDTRQMFDNAAEYAQLYPDATREPVRFCAPRVEDGWELAAVRRRLECRAQSLRALTDAADTGGSRTFGTRLRLRSGLAAG